jgi:flagellar motor switch protein FliG
MSINGLEKAAILIMTLQDENLIREIFSKLDQNEIYEISLAMTNLGNIESDKVEKVLIEFAHDLNQSLQLVGNVKTTEKFLKQVLNDQEYNKVIDKIKHANTSSTWDMLGNINDLSIAQFIKYESPQTSALILSKIPGHKAAKILKLLNQDHSIEILKRMIYLDFIEPDILNQVEQVLENEINSMSSQFNKNDNISIIAEIFNNLSKDDEEVFMLALREEVPEAATKIENTILKFEDLLFISEDAIPLIIQQIDNNILITALATADKAIQDQFLKSMSPRVARMIQDEINSGNRFSKQAISAAQNEILKLVKQMINDDSITINKNI